MKIRNERQLEMDIKNAKNPREKALAYYNLGLFHDNNSREIKAIPNYLKALDYGLNKNLKSMALAWLASSFYKTGRSKEALKRANESKKIANVKLKKFLIGLERRIQKSF